MASDKTPGVDVEEISTLPPSVAEVATAVPAIKTAETSLYNAIRAFKGKGTLVWGARTLAGNVNEAATWLKVKGMIEGCLYGLWEKGALRGSTPQSAYFVHVGLGETMTPRTFWKAA
jgi:phage tail sheath protein FI